MLCAGPERHQLNSPRLEDPVLAQAVSMPESPLPDIGDPLYVGVWGHRPDCSRGKCLSARFFRSQFGSDERRKVAKYVIIVEVPSMAEHSEHDADPEFQEFDRLADAFQPEGPLVFGGDLVHSVG